MNLIFEAIGIKVDTASDIDPLGNSAFHIYGMVLCHSKI